MSKPDLTRRQAIAGAAAVAALCILCEGQPIRLSFPRGAPVPPWIEVSTKPAFFGVAVDLIEEIISPEKRAKFIQWGYRDVPQTRLKVQAAEALGIGDCLVRYKAGSRTLFAAKEPFRGRTWWTHIVSPAESWMWTKDGSDMLLFARVAEPEFRIVNSRLAERVTPGTAQG